MLGPATLDRPEQRAAGKRLGCGRHGRELAAERGKEKSGIHLSCEIVCLAVEFGRKVAGVDRVGVGVDVERGIGHVVANERDAVGHGTGADVGGCDGRPGVDECAGESGPRADPDLDEPGELAEACGEGASERVHDGAFIIGEA